MGLLKMLFGGQQRKSVAPFQQTSNIPPQENYAGYTSLPNLPMSRGDWVPDPYRMHAPFQIERGNRDLVTGAGVHRFNQGDTSVERVPDQPLQQYFNQKKELSPLRIFAPAHGVFVPTHAHIRKAGFMGQFVPQQEAPRPPISGVSPVTLLSTPINQYTNKRNVQTQQNVRAPIKGAKAPKPKRS